MSYPNEETKSFVERLKDILLISKGYEDNQNHKFIISQTVLDISFHSGFIDADELSELSTCLDEYMPDNEESSSEEEFPNETANFDSDSDYDPFENSETDFNDNFGSLEDEVKSDSEDYEESENESDN